MSDTGNLDAFTRSVLGHVAEARSRQVGDYIQPLVDGWRTELRVTARRVSGDSVFYDAVDRFGKVYDVWAADDPRLSTEEAFDAQDGAP